MTKLTGKEKRILNKKFKAGKITLEEYENILSGTIYKNNNNNKTTGHEKVNTKNIIINDFSLNNGKTQLLHNTTLKIIIDNSHRYCIIGNNGCGKTTLLNYIKNIANENLKIIHVEQEIQHYGNVTVFDYLLDKDIDNKNMKKRLKSCPDEDKRELYKELKECGYFKIEKKATTILNGLGFENIHQNVNDLSGGWKMRLSLAQSLFIEPDLLLLDEPTNHLDLKAIIWLQDHLSQTYNNCNKSVIIVSHDIGFINNIATNIIIFDKKELNYFKGNYSAYDNFIDNKKKDLKKSFKNEKKLLETLRNTKKKNKKINKDIKIVKNNIFMMKKELYGNKDINFINIPDCEVNNINPMISLKNVNYNVDEKILFKNINLSIYNNSRICIIGPNGIGKSTLMKIILEKLKPSDGDVIKNNRLRYGYFAQHVSDIIENNVHLNSIDIIKLLFKNDNNGENIPIDKNIHEMLSIYGLENKFHKIPVRKLSGGQKSRVIFSLLALHKPNIYFLDEPTNHLDIDIVDNLCNGLNNFNGGIVIITHDQRLIENLCDELWIIENNEIKIFDGSFNDYKNYILSE